ncbi:MAG: aldolase/citrate lyase family protein [Microvirga sp.]
MMPASDPQPRLNAVTRAIGENRKAVGFHMTFPSVPFIEILGAEGFELIYLDCEHGSFEHREIEESCRAAEGSGLTVIARVPRCDPVLISRYLDTGVQGIVVPHVSSAREARAAVEACFYPPLGRRPFASARVAGYRTDIRDFASYSAHANANVTLSIQIEDRQAVENLDEIAGIDGIDYFTIGKNDLNLDLGYGRRSDGFVPEVQDVIDSVERTLATRGRRLKDDVMILGRARDFILSGARAFMARGSEA